MPRKQNSLRSSPISLKWLQISLGSFSKIPPEIYFTGITKLNSLIQATIVLVSCLKESNNTCITYVVSISSSFSWRAYSTLITLFQWINILFLILLKKLHAEFLTMRSSCRFPFQVPPYWGVPYRRSNFLVKFFFPQLTF